MPVSSIRKPASTICKVIGGIDAVRRRLNHHSRASILGGRGHTLLTSSSPCLHVPALKESPHISTPLPEDDPATSRADARKRR